MLIKQLDKQIIIKHSAVITPDFKKDLKLFEPLISLYDAMYRIVPHKLSNFRPDRVFRHYKDFKCTAYGYNSIQSSIEKYAASLCFLNAFIKLGKLHHLEKRLNYIPHHPDIDDLIEHYFYNNAIDKSARNTAIFYLGYEDLWPHSKISTNNLHIKSPLDLFLFK